MNQMNDGIELRIKFSNNIQSKAATCEKGFENCFLKVSLACLGSMAAAVLPSGLWNSEKTFYKTVFAT